MSRLDWMSPGASGPLQRLVRDQRILFLIVGGGNTLFSTLLYAGLVLLLGPQVPAVVSLLLAWVASVVLVFFVYRKLVFRIKGNGWRDFVRFCSVNVASLAINAGLLVLLADFMRLPPIPTQVGITGLVVLFNYFGHKYFSFRR
ncbi:GtrA family protein [Pseudoxanthomonas spadix]|uniref:GtrA family protein n=1 Tax=Pseudoxanthomonas spadix TaxID=415229 RepID=UPI000F001C27|nr:GtrA family protein [Pseudoxanthomonas spadix]MBP3974051.1 GtrA family protein [Pseudoxanthomonas spadix]RMW91988.1 GtrA family protein [Pseudoxanthomonas spadix]